jgi:hypothetical protein
LRGSSPGRHSSPRPCRLRHRRRLSGTVAPETSNLSFTGGVDVPNLVLTTLGADGSIAVRNRGAPTHVLVDVLGFVTGANPAAT